ncbi:MAG: class I SAM-dependent RNA methyltransferase, partial [Deltaproteobacteria bacterium]|nr:class I SAM-dependent RNA methyltransferase [Deltaproteobacteria bacterium]
ALGVEELAGWGARHIRPVYRGIHFEADQKALYRINYNSRYLTRILAPLLTFDCHSTRYLYRKTRGLNWDELFSAEDTFAVFATVSHSHITHSQYAALRLKDAVADYFRETHKKRPHVDRTTPDVWLNLHIEHNRATISVDTSGGSLHRRGYRQDAVEAPMQETVAAAIIGLSEWDGSQPLYDPLCGSGTLLIEALMHYCRIPSCILRQRFGFEFLPDFDRKQWLATKRTEDAHIRPLPAGLIAGSDLSPRAVEAAGKNTGRLPHGKGIQLRIRDFQDIEGLPDTLIVTNPPYGVRMGTKGSAGQLYRALGDFLKQRCKGATACVYFGDRKLIPEIGLRPSWKKPLKSGGLDGRMARFEIY